MTPRKLPRMHPRSHSIEHSKISTPRPSRPRRFAAGIRQSSNTSSAIGDVRRPIFSRCFPMLRPGVSRSTMNAVTPSGAERPVDGRVDDEQVGDRRVRDEGLRAVQHVVIAVTAGDRAHREDVGSGIRLAGAVGADQRAVAEARQIPLPLLVGAVEQDGNRVGPEMGVDRKEEALSHACRSPGLPSPRSAATRPRPSPPYSCGIGMPWTPNSAHVPALAVEDRMSVGFSMRAVQLASRKFDCRALKFLMLGTQLDRQHTSESTVMGVRLTVSK